MKGPETSPTRSAIMRAVRSRDTSPELAVRGVLRSFAPGYRLHRKDIPGRPDIAYIGAKRAIFVHGCFWHGHDCARGARAPKTNADYWRAKIARNKARDAGAMDTLAAMGWRALVIWECELKEREFLARKLRAFVRKP
jgi:DNA mismatch endonuclease (patch repair protein)